MTIVRAKNRKRQQKLASVKPEVSSEEEKDKKEPEEDKEKPAGKVGEVEKSE